MAEIEPKNLIVIGSAPCARDDLFALEMELIPRFAFDYCAVGLDAVDIYTGPIAYVATYHPAEIFEIRDRRAAAGGNLDYRVISHEPRLEVDVFIGDWWKPSGSSALLAIQAALSLGYAKIVLAGCPLQGTNAKAGHYEDFRKGFEAAKDKIFPCTRSMSGWTMEFLGAPSAEWMRNG
jgi:hypothetical protein